MRIQAALKESLHIVSASEYLHSLVSLLFTEAVSLPEGIGQRRSYEISQLLKVILLYSIVLQRKLRRLGHSL